MLPITGLILKISCTTSYVSKVVGSLMAVLAYIYVFYAALMSMNIDVQKHASWSQLSFQASLVLTDAGMAEILTWWSDEQTDR